MNKAQRKRIAGLQADITKQQTAIVQIQENLPLEGYVETIKSIAGALDDIKTDVEEIKDEESEKFEDMPEGLKSSDNGERLENAVTEMELAVDALQLAIDELEEITESAERDGVINCLKAADNYLADLNENLENAAS